MRAKLMAAFVGVLTAVALVATATPASAASFDFRTAFNAGTSHDGAASIWGTVVFFGRYAADIDVAIGDVCPADGYGAYGRLAVTSVHGTTWYSDWFWKDEDGCGGGVHYPVRTHYHHSDIEYIRIHLCEIDWDNGRARGDCAYSTRKDNPHT